MNQSMRLVAGISFLLLSVAIEAQERWSLQECIDYAMSNNIQIRQQEINTEYNRNQLDQAKQDRLPNLNASFSDSYSFGRSLNNENVYENVNAMQADGSLSSGVTLFNGFTMQNTIRQRDLNLQAAMQDLQQVKDNITLNIAASYLEVLFAEELVLIAASQVEVTTQQIGRTRKLVDAGSVARGALLEIEAQLAREELQLVNDQNRLQLAYLNLYQLLELPVEKSFLVEKPKLPEMKAGLSLINALDLFSHAIRVRPEIKAAQLRVEGAKRGLDIARGNRLPVFNLGASYNNRYYNILNSDMMQRSFSEQMKSNSRYGFGLSLNIPIFNRFQVKNSMANAQLQIADQEYRLQAARNVLRKDIELAYTNAVAAHNRYVSGEKAVHSAEEAFRYTEEKFNVGMVNTVEYNQSKTYLTIARSELVQARYDYIFRTKILDFYSGVPIEL